MSRLMDSGVIIGILAGYIGLLFLCAFFGEKYASRFGNTTRMLLFSLTLGVYCSSWTFYGAVGEAVRHGIGFLPIYLGPLLFLWFAYNIWQRLAYIRQHQSISSIADFIAARYGKSGFLAALVTILAVIGILPYLALQLRAIAMSAVVLMADAKTTNSTLTTYGVLVLTAVLAGIAMLFGTRHAGQTEQQGGLMVAIAFESIVKLLALIIVAIFTIFFSQHPMQLIEQDILVHIQHLQQHGLPNAFWTQTLLAASAMICLPRQFHVAVVELKNPRHIQGARIWFSLYLILMIIAIIPIASWASHLPTNLLPMADSAVLMLPIMYQQNWLALLVFIGGFSAATGMLLVATLALSIMLSNDLILPILLRFNLLSRQDKRLSYWIKNIRRFCIALVMLLGFMVYRLFSDINQLSAFGLLAFSAVIQFAPALIGGLYWRSGSRQGVIAGLVAGFTVWGYTLFLPALLRNLSSQSWALTFLDEGPVQWYWLKPEALLGFASLPPLTHGVLWSLGINLLLFIVISHYKPPRIAEQIQAENFFQLPMQSDHGINTSANLIENDMGLDYTHAYARVSINDLIVLSSRINGLQKTEAAFRQFAEHNTILFEPHKAADHRWWRFTEQYLASNIGAASARTLLTTALVNNGMTVGQVVNILDQASQWRRFNQNLLGTMMDHMTQAVSVVDADMCLVAWNRRYLELFDYPDNFVYVGCPVANLIRYNAERGECGPGSIEAHIAKRINWMRAGNPHEFERQRADGRIIEMRGHPITGGGFVTTYADITEFRHTEAVLAARVHERTQQLEGALQQQQQAREQADLANMSKTRFVAAASHDLLQPMHAARLFAAALDHADLPEQEQHTLQQLDRALHGAESILSALLDIARLDNHGMKPNISEFALADLLNDLKSQYAATAEQRGLVLQVHTSKHWVNTDPQWLRRILQNLLSNALRYTAQGRVVVGVLNSASSPQHIRVGVWDTGPGINEEQQQLLFAEFQRGGHTSPWGEQGLGLGLAIVDRMAKRLNHSLIFSSKVGQGSSFVLELPTVAAHMTMATPRLPNQHKLQQLQILCLDNDPAILQGMQILLSKWGCQLFVAQTPKQAQTILDQHLIHVLLVDQHLNANVEGLDFLIQFNTRQVPAALITADSDPILPQRLKELGIVLLKKPLKPAALRAFLAGIKN